MPVDEHCSTLAARNVSAEHPVLGARYEILALLGSGGMGNVGRARDRELDEIVALEVRWTCASRRTPARARVIVDTYLAAR